MSVLSNQNSSFCILGVPMCLIFVELLLMRYIRVPDLRFCLMCCRYRNQIHKIWIIPQFSWCKCQFSWSKCRSVVSFDNCTCLAPSANSSMSQTSANRHHLSPGYPVSWPPSPPPPQNKYPCPCESLNFTCFQLFFVPCFSHTIPHLHCRNLGLPHEIGVSRAVIYMSLLGPTIV